MEGIESNSILEASTLQGNLINGFSHEIFYRIFSALPLEDILNCRLVCSTWRDSTAVLLMLKNTRTAINFRTNNDIRYFSLLMRTSAGAQIPFSKFTFHFDVGISANVVEEFFRNYGSEVNRLTIQFNFRKSRTYKICAWEIYGGMNASKYMQSVHALLFNTSMLTSLSLAMLYEVAFPAADEASYAQTFQNLKKLKVKFILIDSAFRHTSSDQVTMLENIIKHSPRLEVLSLLYYPYFCSVPNRINYHIIILTPEVQRLPNFLRLLRLPSTKVKLRLGIITNTFRKVSEELMTLRPQPRIVAIAVSLPAELELQLKTSLWYWIHTLPLSKLKFFENGGHFPDFPDLPTGQFHTLHQLRLTRVTNITSNNTHLLFPNLKKLTVHIRCEHNGTSMSVDYEAFRSLAAAIPHLEHLVITGDSWEVLTAEPSRGDEIDIDTENYVLQQIEIRRGNPCEIGSPITKLRKLKSLQIQAEHKCLCGALYASETGRLQRLNRFIFRTQLAVPGDDFLERTVPGRNIRKFHDNVEFIIEYIR